MPTPTPSPRPRRAARVLAGAALATALATAGACSSSSDDAGSGTTATTEAVAPDTTGAGTPAGDTSTTTGAAGPTTTSPSASPPSSLPGELSGTCDALEQTYGLDAITPQATSSWVDERMRIVVDARREAQLLGVAAEGAPADLVPDISLMKEYSEWLAGAMEASDSYSAAVDAINDYPRNVEVALSIARVATWERANC